MKMIMFTLDFTIFSTEDRCKYVNSFDLSKLSKKELELCSNYILYGKDSDGTSLVDRKEIEIKPKFSSYAKKAPVSLDALLESPTFNENMLRTGKNIYKKVKPTIDREKLKNVKGMKELWAEIDRLQNILDQNTGKKEKEENTPTLSNRELYYLRHNLIDLRLQQYYLMDSEFPTVGLAANKAQYYGSIVDGQLSYEVLPRGLMSGENDTDFKEPRKNKSGFSHGRTEEEENKLKQANSLDFRNKKHIYQLIINYWDIYAAVEKLPDSPLHNLLWTLDFYIEKANLNEQQMLIVRDKKMRILNKDIQKHLQDELGIYHQENYISTIWNKICAQIVEAVELNYDEWLMKDYDKAWKTCCRCGKEMLRDSRNFVKKSKAVDGLTGRCKKCDKEIRNSKK